MQPDRGAQPRRQEDGIDQVEVAVQAGKAAPRIVGGTDFWLTQVQVGGE